MSRRGILFAVLFSAVAAGVVWDRANLGVGRRDAEVPDRPRTGGTDQDEIVLVIGGTHPPPDEALRRADPPHSPHRAESVEKRPLPRPSTVAPPGPPSARTCRVAPGETLRAIAGRELGDPERWPEIAALNGIDDPRRLLSGTEIVIPSGYAPR